MFKDFVIDVAYYLDTSIAYEKRKNFVRDILENENNKYKKYIDIFMITLIFISVGVLIREVKHPVNDYLLFFSNYVISIIFFIEYILRLWVKGSISRTIVERSEYDTFLLRDVALGKALKDAFSVKFRYISSPQAIIDLLAILPFFHEFRLLRIFILFRLFKLFRYAKSIQLLLSVLATKKFEFLMLGIFSSVVILISSVLIYAMEANVAGSQINSIYRAVYWSIVTISTVGYGDETPITDEGRFVAILVISAGIGVLAYTTSLFVSAFTEKLDEIKEVKTVEYIAKLPKFYLICGYSGIAGIVANKLKRVGNKIIVIDKNKTNISLAIKDGFTALHYDPGSIESYTKLNLDFDKQVKYILCLHEDDVANVYTALTIRSYSKNVKILSLLVNDTNRKKLEFAGINKSVYPQELVGLITKELVGLPVAFEVIHELRSEHSNVKIDELGITKRIAENFTMVSELDNKRYRVVLLGIYKSDKDRFYFNPLDNTILEVGDYLLVVGYAMLIREFEKYLHKKVSNE